MDSTVPRAGAGFVAGFFLLGQGLSFLVQGQGCISDGGGRVLLEDLWSGFSNSAFSNTREDEYIE